MRIGLIGGNGHHYLRGALATLRPGVAVAGDGADDDAARRLADGLDGARWFDDAAAMLDQFKPDVASIGAVYAHNGRWAIEAMQRRIPTVSDKPIATDWATLNTLRSVAGRTPLITEFNFRSDAAFRAATLCVREKRVDPVLLVTGQKSYRFGTRPPWYARRELYGGTIPWIASHAIDAAVFVTGRRLAAVAGAAGNGSRPDYGTMEDHAACLFEYEGGGVALIHADFLRPAGAPTHGDDRLRIAGGRGVVEVREGRCVLMHESDPPQDVTARGGEPVIWRDLLDAARGDTTWYGTERSLGMAAILLAARDAADGRRRVELDPAWSIA